MDQLLTTDNPDLFHEFQKTHHQALTTIDTLFWILNSLNHSFKDAYQETVYGSLFQHRFTRPVAYLKGASKAFRQVADLLLSLDFACKPISALLRPETVVFAAFKTATRNTEHAGQYALGTIRPLASQFSTLARKLREANYL